MRERRFVDEYLISFNGREALHRAGYSRRDKGSWRVRNRPAVRAALEAGWRAKVGEGGVIPAFPAVRRQAGRQPGFGNVYEDPVMRPLTPREIGFVDAFIECGNARAAARQAGYSPAVASRGAYLIRRRPNVAAAIAARVEASLEAMGIYPERLIAAMYKQAFFDPIVLKDAVAPVVDLERLEPDVRLLLSIEYSQTVGGKRIRWKTPDRRRAMGYLWKFIESQRKWQAHSAGRFRCEACGWRL